MLQGFKQFILRGNVLDLAVAVVMGVAFGAVVTALVKDLITPLIAAIVGKPDFSAIQFEVNGSKFLLGDFVNVPVAGWCLHFPPLTGDGRLYVRGSSVRGYAFVCVGIV